MRLKCDCSPCLLLLRCKQVLNCRFMTRLVFFSRCFGCVGLMVIVSPSPSTPLFRKQNPRRHMLVKCNRSCQSGNEPGTKAVSVPVVFAEVYGSCPKICKNNGFRKKTYRRLTFTSCCCLNICILVCAFLGLFEHMVNCWGKQMKLRRKFSEEQ